MVTEQLRTVRVALVPAAQQDFHLRIDAAMQTFGQLAACLRQLPGADEDSYVELFLDEEDRFVRLLDADPLPAAPSELLARVHVGQPRPGTGGVLHPQMQQPAAATSPRAARKQRKLERRIERVEDRHACKLERLQGKLQRFAAGQAAASGQQPAARQGWGCCGSARPAADDPSAAGAAAQPVATGFPIASAKEGLKGLRLDAM